MDQCKNGILLVGDIEADGHDQGTFGLKQMLPECFVSVKLETYEDSGTPEAGPDRTPTAVTGILRTSCCNQPGYNCICSDSRPNCVVITPTSSAPFTCQLVPTTMMPQQEQTQGNAQGNAQAQVPPQGQAQQTQASSHHQQSTETTAQSSHSRSTPSAHSFSQAHARAAELPWLPHGYVDTAAVVAQGGSQFQHHQMQYLTADALVTQAGGDRIMIKQGSANPVVRTDNAGIISTISGLTGAEGCDSNTFLNYVLNQQRGAPGSGILLSFEPPRNLSSHIVQQSHGISREEVSRGSNLSLKLERQVEESPRNSTPADNSDTGSAADSPNPGEVVGNQVSRYCQTMPITPQQQDAKTSTEDFDEECKNINGANTSIGSYIIKQGVKHITFGHIRPTVNCQSPLNNLEHGANSVEAHLDSDETKCHEQVMDSSRGVILKQEGQNQDESLRRGAQLKTDNADGKMGANKIPVPPYACLETLERIYRCEICGKTYPTQQALINHDRYHRGERPYECETCHKAFATNSHLVTHRRTHTGERPFSCQICNRSFADRSAFMKHERTHGPNGSIIKRYKCEECGNGFVDSCGLKKHTRIHTGERPYICVVCQKAFSTSSTFVAHRRIHTGERPYKCESCDKMFVTKSHLLTHRRKHTGEKPFTCSVCNRCFADGSSFRRHERLHTGENRHVCDICGRGFPLESSLERHKQTHIQTSNFAYIYENRNDLNALNQRSPQQQQTQQEQDQQQHRVIACDVQQNHCVLPQESIPVDSEHSNIGVDLSQEMTPNAEQVQRGNICTIPTCDIDCDSQRNHSNAVPTRELV